MAKKVIKKTVAKTAKKPVKKTVKKPAIKPVSKTVNKILKKVAAIKSSEPLPIRSSSHIKEDASKEIFTSFIKPWMVVSWLEKDYGIDAIIEITKPIAYSQNQIVTGKRVSVQLKSSTSNKFDKNSFSLSVPKEKVNYWTQSFEPVILVFIDINSQAAYYRWIDQALIQELFKSNGDWIAQDTVSIKFNKDLKITSKTLGSIEKYVLAWKRQSKTLLTPGNYFKFSNEAHQYSEKLKSICEKYGINALRSEVDDLLKEVSNSIYTIAIIGLSRAGKSTLINALLEREISPMGKLPTTGVPISIFPKDENRAFVTFKNDKVMEGEASSEFLAEYTTQDNNQSNKKEVRYVRVHVINTLLERGFALCDVPGLDDADPIIKNIAKTAIINANAIVYVISLAGYEDGEFRINDRNIEDLHELRGKMDRVFLVFNKVDKLSSTDLDEVKGYIDRVLKQFDVLDFLAAPPIFISSGEAFKRRINKQEGTDTVSQLEQVLWEYLINQNRTGLHKVISNFANQADIISKLRTITLVRLDGAEKRTSLEAEIRMVNDEIRNLQQFIRHKREGMYNQIHSYTIDRFNNVINHLSNELNSVSASSTIPSHERVSGFLENEAYKILSDVYEHLQQESYTLQADVNLWISEKLKQVEFSIDNVQRNQSFKMPDIKKYTGQVRSFFIENNGGYIGMLETIVGGIGRAFEWLFSSVFDFFTSDEKIIIRIPFRYPLVLLRQFGQLGF